MVKLSNCTEAKRKYLSKLNKEMAGAKVAIDNISQEYEINLSEYFAYDSSFRKVFLRIFAH